MCAQSSFGRSLCSIELTVVETGQNNDTALGLHIDWFLFRLDGFEVYIGENEEGANVGENTICGEAHKYKGVDRGGVPATHVECRSRPGRYVYVTLPRLGILTLCEVMVEMADPSVIGNHPLPERLMHT